MVILLSGVESVNKKLISRQITGKLNTFIVDEYYLDFTMDDPFGIKNSDGEDISTEEFLLTNDDNKEILSRMEKLEEKLREQETKNHLFGKYEANEYELGIIVKPRYCTDDREFSFIPYNITLKNLINNAKNTKQDYFVITGSMSKTFINEFRKEFGEENVKAYNIIRNPSTCFVLNYKDDEYFNANSTYHRMYDFDKLSDSLTNGYLLAQDKSVTTIKFEDMIKDGLIIDGKDVGLYLGFNAKNSWLTEYEFSRLKDYNPVTNDDLLKFNERFKKLKYIDLVDKFDKNFLTKEELRKIEALPMTNVFERLGYEPLTLKEITSL